jgi:4-amino-4-deoxy-L-arabinose transferase-like glycosyltransferase
LKIFALPIFLLIVLTVPHLEQGDFRRDTVRYAAIGEYMYHGGSWLAPHLNPERVFFNKPPMVLWIHGLFLRVFGTHLAVARVPSILAAIGVLVFSMLAVSHLGTRHEALLSGLVLASTYEFFRRTREISLDLWQLFFMMAAVWLMARAIRGGGRRDVILCGLPLGLALLCKPLVGLMCLPIFALWLVLAGRPRLTVWLGVAALPLALLVATPWHLYMYETFGQRFVGQYFVNEIIDRAQRSDQPSSIYYYLAENVWTYWPWMIGLALAVYFAMKNRPSRSHFVSLAAVWVLVWFVALSLFPDRKPNYALPLYPMLAWMAGWGIGQWPRFEVSAWCERHFRWLVSGFALALLAVSLAPLEFQRPPERNWLALVHWLKANRVEAADLTYANIDLNDVCYVYLKTGGWMKTISTAGNKNSDSPRKLVTKLLGKDKPGEQEEILFHSGPVYVLSKGAPDR